MGLPLVVSTCRLTTATVFGKIRAVSSGVVSNVESDGSSRHMKRRSFLNNSAMALGALSSGLSARTQDARKFSARPVRVTSIGFHPGISLEAIAALVDQEGA